jgi:hypothetical protein
MIIYQKLNKFDIDMFKYNLSSFSDVVLNFIRYVCVPDVSFYTDPSKKEDLKQRTMKTTDIIIACIPYSMMKGLLKVELESLVYENKIKLKLKRQIPIENYQSFFDDIQIIEEIINSHNENFNSKKQNAIEERQRKLQLYLSDQKNIQNIIASFKKAKQNKANIKI